MWVKGKDDFYSLKAQTTDNISLEIVKWDADEYTWLQSSTKEQGKVSYILKVSEANSFYIIYDGNKSVNSKSDKNGFLKFETISTKKTVTLTIKRQNK